MTTAEDATPPLETASSPSEEQAEFERFVRSELGDIAVKDGDRYISPKINNYWRTWQAARSGSTAPKYAPEELLAMVKMLCLAPSEMLRLFNPLIVLAEKALATAQHDNACRYRDKGGVMSRAFSLCPSDQPHPQKMTWIANYYEENRNDADASAAAKKRASEMVTDIMEQAQVFASAWSLPDGPFDDGNALKAANAEKEVLRTQVLVLAGNAARGMKPLTETASAAVPKSVVEAITAYGDARVDQETVGAPMSSHLRLGACIELIRELLCPANSPSSTNVTQ